MFDPSTSHDSTAARPGIGMSPYAVSLIFTAFPVRRDFQSNCWADLYTFGANPVNFALHRSRSSSRRRSPACSPAATAAAASCSPARGGQGWRRLAPRRFIQGWIPYQLWVAAARMRGSRTTGPSSPTMRLEI
jgi:hypothetical protein